MVTIVFTPISPARRMVCSISLRWRSPIGPGSSGLAEQLSAAISRPRASISFSAALSAPLSASSRSARKCGPRDQPPPVISMPSTPSFTHLSSMSVKERSPITSVQMESFMCLVLRDVRLLEVDPDRAALGRADAVLEPAHALGAGLDARVVVGLRGRPRRRASSRRSPGRSRGRCWPSCRRDPRCAARPSGRRRGSPPRDRACRGA